MQRDLRPRGGCGRLFLDDIRPHHRPRPSERTCTRRRTARRRGLAYQVFDASDGLPGTEFARGGNRHARGTLKGRLSFATSKGAAIIDPELRSERSAPADPRRGDFVLCALGRVPRGPSGGNSPTVSGKVLLPAGSRRLEISYTGSEPGRAGEGAVPDQARTARTEWQDVGDRRVAYYYDLPPRDYVFRVRAANKDGVWNEAGASLAFTVQPHLADALVQDPGLVVLAAAGLPRLSPARDPVGEGARGSARLHPAAHLRRRTNANASRPSCTMAWARICS